MTALVRLYPRAWRDRYEDEFLAVLAERPARWADRFDILFSAIDAHLDPEVPGRPEDLPDQTPTRRGPPAGALLALVGGGLWIATAASLLLAPVTADGYRSADLAGLLILGGVVVQAGASFALAARLPRQPTLARIGGVLLLVSAGSMLFGWPWLALGIYASFIASMLVGAALAGNGARVIGPILALTALVALGVNTESWLPALVVPYGLAWMTVGAAQVLGRIPGRAVRPATGPSGG